MRVLVTGASGFVGSYLVEKLLNAGYEVFAGSNTTPTSPNISAKWLKLDINDRENFLQVIEASRPDLVYHLAAISFVPQAEQNFKLALETNCCGTENLFLALQAAGLDHTKVVYISSAEVYGAFKPADLPLHEATACNPLSNYAISKLTAEMVVDKFKQRGNFKVLIFRPFNHIGPGQADNFAVASFSKQIAAIKLGQQEPLLKVGNLTVEIDFLDVRDVVAAYLLVAEQGEGLYNLASGQSHSLTSVIETLQRLANVDLKIEIDPQRYRPAERPVLVGDSSKFRAAFNWRPVIELEVTLHDCLDFWLKKLGE